MMNVLVVGTGFEGIYTAYRLARDHGCSVHLVDPSPVFGGVMSGTVHREMGLDLGCQVFDNFDPNVTATIQALSRDRCIPTTITYGSRIHGVTSRDMAAPDLSAMPGEIMVRLLEEVISAPKTPPTTATLRAFYETKWGPTVADLLEPVNHKVFGRHAAALDGHNHISVGLNRIRIADDVRSAALKSTCPILDERIAVSRAAHTALYPAARAMIDAPNIHPNPLSLVGFCRDAWASLLAVGVKTAMGTDVVDITAGDPIRVTLHRKETSDREVLSVDAVVWAARFAQLERILFSTNSIAQYIEAIGLHIFYHFAPAAHLSEIGYFQNYDDDIDVFRWSSMGRYTNQTTAEGLTFCCTEVPDHEQVVSGPEYADHHWSELQQLGLVKGSHDGAPHYIHARRCISRFTPGFSVAAKAVMNKVDATHPMLVYSSPFLFGRIPMARNLYSRMSELLK